MALFMAAGTEECGPEAASGSEKCGHDMIGRLLLRGNLTVVAAGVDDALGCNLTRTSWYEGGLSEDL